MSRFKAGYRDGSLWFAQLSTVFLVFGLLSVDIASSQAQFQPPLQLCLNQVGEQIGGDLPYYPPKRGIPGRREAAGSR